MAMVNLKEFSLASLAEIDGKRLALAFDAELKRIAADIDDRPGVATARELTLKVAVVPVLDVSSGIAEQARVQCQVSAAIPKRKTKVWDMSVRKGGKLLYRPDSEDNAEQMVDFGEE